MENKMFFVTLTQELSGYCLVAYAPDESTLRSYLADKYGKVWCSVYTEKPLEAIIGEPIYL